MMYNQACEDGLRWPLITERGLRRRLDGTVTNGEEYMDRRILTIPEELQLAKWLRSESRVGRAKNRGETRQEIAKLLQCRLKNRVAA